jgi:hypothetical protein
MKRRKKYFLYFLFLPTIPVSCPAQFNTIQKLPQVVKSKPTSEVQTDSCDLAASEQKSSKEYFDLPSHQEIALEYDIPLWNVPFTKVTGSLR